MVSCTARHVQPVDVADRYGGAILHLTLLQKSGRDASFVSGLLAPSGIHGLLPSALRQTILFMSLSVLASNDRESFAFPDTYAFDCAGLPPCGCLERGNSGF